MGLLFANLLNHTETLTCSSGEQETVFSVLRYVEEHYQGGSLGELAAREHYELTALSRLIRAGIGFGFTLLEEFLYGSAEGVTAIARLLTVASHMVFGIIMARHLGTAKYNKIKGSGSVTGEYVLALIVPILLHTLYDAGTATNAYMNSGKEENELIGIVIALVVTVALFIVQIAVPVRLKKNTEKYCGMLTGSADKQVLQ